jgi:hypothetical protein
MKTSKILLLSIHLVFCPFNLSFSDEHILAESKVSISHLGSEISVKELFKDKCVITGLYTQCTNPAKCPAVASWISNLDNALTIAKSDIKIIVFNFDANETSEQMTDYSKKYGSSAESVGGLRLGEVA